MKAVEGILAVLGTLGDKEREQVRRALESQLSPCARLGHKYPSKPIEVMTSIFAPTKKFYVCQKCGHKLEL